MATKPGAKYVYNSGNAILLGEIIRKASGMSVDQFAETNLFKPLGMSAYTWKGPFTNGVVHTGGGLFLRPRDMAKIGSLVLNQGRWQGRQIVSEKFIRALTTKQAPDFEYAGPVYGYEWKLCTVTNSNRKITFFVSDGYAGQYILAFPGQDLVVVSTAWTMSPAWNFINPLLESILPAVHGDAYQIAKQKN
jgi:CubicO group peptidase (beta-lactamase class C family)